MNIRSPHAESDGNSCDSTVVLSAALVSMVSCDRRLFPVSLVSSSTRGTNPVYVAKFAQKNQKNLRTNV